MKRFLLIGLDGAEPTLVERWMGEGRLPNLSAIREKGALLPCASTMPPATFPAWTTCVTGVNPGRHGIIDFTYMPKGEYGIRFTNATHRSAPALWNIVSDAGGRVCVLGVPATYPPEPVNGVMVSGFDSPVCQRIDKSFVYPESAYATATGWPFADFQESSIGEGWHDMAFRKLMDGIVAKEKIACDFLRQEEWDFSMIVFGESDTVSHHFWMFHDSDSPRFQESEHRNAIRDVYVRLDEAVGRLIEAAGDVAVGIVSDHGFGGAGLGVAHVNNWLAEHEYLQYSQAEADSILKRVGLSVVPPSLRGAIFRRLTGVAQKAEGRSRFGGIDWAQTKAWSEELPYFPSVRINLKGREPEGIVSPKDYESTCDEIIDALKSWDVIEDVRHRDDVLSGPHVERAPDLFITFARENGYPISGLRARGGPAYRVIDSAEAVGGKERGMNGVHFPTGIFMTDQATDARETSLLDVAPTVLATMGLAAPEMDGRSLTGAAEDVVKAQNYERSSEEYTPEESAILEERLRGLGYFE